VRSLTRLLLRWLLLISETLTAMIKMMMKTAKMKMTRVNNEREGKKVEQQTNKRQKRQ